MLRHLINAHHFFCRKSQHYVLGNWWRHETNRLGWPTKKAWLFVFRFPVAYVKFMGWAIYDGWHGHRYPRY